MEGGDKKNHPLDKNGYFPNPFGHKTGFFFL